MAHVRRLRDGDMAFEPEEKVDHRHVICNFCRTQVLKKKAIRRKGKWICPDCLEDE